MLLEPESYQILKPAETLPKPQIETFCHHYEVHKVYPSLENPCFLGTFDNIVHHIPMHVRQPKIPTLEPIRQPLVIDA